VRAALGLGCDALVDIMIERAGTPGRIDPLELADQCIRMQRRAAIVPVIRSEAPGIATGTRVAVVDRQDAIGDAFDAALRAGMIADARAAIATGESCNRTYRSDAGNVDVFIEAILPPPRVFLFGTGHDAVPVAQLAKSLGWDVVLCVDEARVATRQRFNMVDEILVGSHIEIATRVDECDRAIAVVMSHDYATDKANLGMLVGTRCRYIGVLGPRTRTQRMGTELGLGLQLDARIHGPIGLEIDAETPQEIALAIASEIQTVLSSSPGCKLRDRVGAIHGRSSGVMPRIAEAVASAGPVQNDQLPVAS
jgi:xanthine/CO dehydrogenase XdhC/CoxF family maturation factor